jgi:hypothetical protein
VSRPDELVEQALKELSNHSPLLARNAGGRPQGDVYGAKKCTLYLRVDAIEWLRQEALRRGNGWSVGRIVTEWVRAAREAQNKSA